MKMHKIRNVEKSVCTCEQKIAYNYAFLWRTQLEDIYRSEATQSVKEEEYQHIINNIINGIEREGIDKRYSSDAIIHCFKNGLETYLSGFAVLWSYEEIGKVFTCSYEIE